MDRIQIRNTPHITTRLGFGCAHLVGAVPWQQSRRLLDCAYENGIRHFDVAPMYGFSDAERCLGEFVKSHRQQITITTKFGIPPGKRRRLYRLARSVAGPLLRRVKTRRQTSQSPIKAETTSTDFHVDAATKSLDGSLKRLRTDHVHIFLLHEPTAADLNDERLLQFLLSSVASGKIGTFGVGSDRSKIHDLLKKRREYCPVAQYQWDDCEGREATDDSFRIYHGLFNLSVQSFRDRLHADRDRCREWSDAIGIDLRHEAMFTKLVIRSSMLLAPHAMLLIASKRPEHIVANCDAAADSTIDAAALRFSHLLKQFRLESQEAVAPHDR